MSLSLQLQYVTTASITHYVEVSQFRTQWNCCGSVSVHQTAVVPSSHCSIATVVHLTESWQTVGPPSVTMVSY